MYGQFSFLALNKKSDWERGRGENLLLAEEGISLMKDQKYVLYRTVMQTETGIAEPITHLSSGSFGLLYLLDRAGNLWTYDFFNCQTTLLLKEGHGLFSGEALLAAAKNTLFLVESNPAAIIAVSATNGQILWTKSEFYGGSPLAIVVSASEHLLVVTSRKNPLSLDKGHDSDLTQLAVLKVSPDGQIKVLTSPPSFILEKLGECPQQGRVQAALGKEGQLFVMDSCNGNLWMFDPNGNLLANKRLNLSARANGLGVDKEGFIYIADAQQIDHNADDERFLLKFSSSDWGGSGSVAYRGEVDYLWLDSDNRIFVWNQSNLSLSILERQENIRLDSNGTTRGVFIFPVQDSTALEMEWHRFTLDADIPDDTQIRLNYFASDNKELIIQDHLINIEGYLQDRSAPLPDKLGSMDFLWKKELVNPRDALLQGVKGRYLWLKIELVGSETRTPLLRSVRIYFPRMSLLSYLPAVYQENEGSRDFLERFLSLPGTLLQEMEEQIESLDRIFDPEVVSGPFLGWLAGWLGICADENWSEEQLRRLLISAPNLYRKRGTRTGMEDIIAIYTGEKPIIVEYFQYKYLQQTIEIKQLMSQLYGQDPYGFAVMVKQEMVPTAAQVAALQRIIDEEKPAFTDARLVILQPWIYMDMHSYLGINTYLSELSLLRLDNKSSVPFGSVIVDMERDNQLDTHSRMELDAHLR
jgi:phage tail-like protein